MLTLRGFWGGGGFFALFEKHILNGNYRKTVHSIMAVYKRVLKFPTTIFSINFLDILQP